MAIGAIKLYGSLPWRYCGLVQCSFIRSLSSSQTLGESIKAAVEAKAYKAIPELLLASEETGYNPNYFSFLSSFPRICRTQAVHEILQSLITIRPRSLPRALYASLLWNTFQNPSPLPLALAIIQRILRSGCVPVPQTHLLLSSAWMEHRRQSLTVASILLEMKSIGYDPDTDTCNYLLLSLCAVDQLGDAGEVLRGMGKAGCIPDLESYGTVISSLCTARKTDEAMDMLKQMVEKVKLTPREGTIRKLITALRANKKMLKAVEMIEFLEREDCTVGFESYEAVAEGCLRYKQYVLAGKIVLKMTEKGFIPHIKVRQKVLENLVSVGELDLACAVRQRLSELGS